jgi:hypothetical protein
MWRPNLSARSLGLNGRRPSVGAPPAPIVAGIVNAPQSHLVNWFFCAHYALRSDTCRFGGSDTGRSGVLDKPKRTKPIRFFTWQCDHCLARPG